MLGGVGDVTAALDADGKDVYLYFSQYSRDGATQGVAVARLAWADRDAPSARPRSGTTAPGCPRSESRRRDIGWAYPAGTPLVRSNRPFHDRSATNDVFWGASIHWNTYLEQYVMLLNRAKDDQFGQEGIYVSFSPTLRAARWSAPAKILDGGGWYPQVIGGEAGTGTDRTRRQARAVLHDRAIGTDDRVRTLTRAV